MLVQRGSFGSYFIPCFKERKAGSRSLRRGLANLIRAADLLLQHSNVRGKADSYFTSLVCQWANDPKLAALQLGLPGGDKLPSLGVALAAETLKNLGFDVAKPDRHMLRAVESFGLVEFNGKKHTQGMRGYPETRSRKKLLEVMRVAERIAQAAATPVAFVDNAIWLLCPKDELYQTNSELARMVDLGCARTS